mmetsp:Transcript_11770/g.16652  ORF Transcript_11770/g.16652 Transcript_11770/m.16652 type:complete len:242 (+) Transcript_11770:59-784(+)
MISQVSKEDCSSKGISHRIKLRQVLSRRRLLLLLLLLLLLWSSCKHVGSRLLWWYWLTLIGSWIGWIPGMLLLLLRRERHLILGLRWRRLEWICLTWLRRILLLLLRRGCLCHSRVLMGGATRSSNRGRTRPCQCSCLLLLVSHRSLRRRLLSKCRWSCCSSSLRRALLLLLWWECRLRLCKCRRRLLRLRWHLNNSRLLLWWPCLSSAGNGHVTHQTKNIVCFLFAFCYSISYGSTCCKS